MMNFQKLRVVAATITVSLLLGWTFSALPQYKQKKNDKTDLPPLEIKANVLALERDGEQPINDLKAEDFKIYEDGVEQKVTFFAEKKSALNIGFVMDNSGSLRPKLNRIAQLGKTLANNLNPADKAFVIRFISSDRIEVLQDWTTNKKLAAMAFDKMFIEPGQSAIIDAIQLAAEKISNDKTADKTARNAILLVTDGEDRRSYYKLTDALPLLKTADVQVFTLALTDDLAEAPARKAEALVNTLALESGGKTFVLKRFNDQELVAALSAIIVELRSQYVVGYASTNPKRDGKTRKLTVQILDGANGEKRAGYIRESFVVPENKK